MYKYIQVQLVICYLMEYLKVQSENCRRSETHKPFPGRLQTWPPIHRHLFKNALELQIFLPLLENFYYHYMSLKPVELPTQGVTYKNPSIPILPMFFCSFFILFLIRIILLSELQDVLQAFLSTLCLFDIIWLNSFALHVRTIQMFAVIQTSVQTLA